MLIGRLGKDPEFRNTQGGNSVANFTMATDESYTDKNRQKVDATEWHRVVAWGKLADLVANYLHKGSLVYIEGKLQTRKWQDQQGQDRYTTEIVARIIQFLESKTQAEQHRQGQQGGTAPAPGYGGQQAPPQQNQSGHGNRYPPQDDPGDEPF
jgi:single-strand DNA-binding protein